MPPPTNVDLASRSATRALFRRDRRKLNEYSGQAMSYQVLEQWAALGIGAAILPRSRITAANQTVLAIIDKSGNEAMIGFEAMWSEPGEQPDHIMAFVRYLQRVVPGLVSGLQVTSMAAA
jgi:DNA-binding transcriptional LysR family regulator